MSGSGRSACRPRAGIGRTFCASANLACCRAIAITWQRRPHVGDAAHHAREQEDIIVEPAGPGILALFGDAIEYVQPPLCSEDDVFACGEALCSEGVQLLGTEAEQHLELDVLGSELRIMLGA